MAIEEKVILEVDALGEESINSLREKVKNLKSELNQTTIATTEWDEKSAALANVQDKLNKVLIISKNSAQAVGGSFNDLNQQLAVLKAAWKAAGTEIERAQLREQINAVKSQLNEMNESIGNFQHNVGNYSSAFSGLQLNVQQVARELPSLTYGANQFFLAISNNVPMLVDSVKQFRESGNTWAQTISAIGKSLFSWNTLITIIITLLSAFGGEIIEWVKNLFSAKDASDAVTDSLNAMRSAMEKETEEVSTLFAALRNAKKGTVEYATVRQTILDKYGQYLQNQREEIANLNDIAAAEKVVGDAIKSKALARAYEQQIEDATKKYAEDINKALDGIYEIFLKRFGDQGEDVAKEYYIRFLQGVKSEDPSKMIEAFNIDKMFVPGQGGFRVSGVFKDVREAYQEYQSTLQSIALAQEILAAEYNISAQTFETAGKKVVTTINVVDKALKPLKFPKKLAGNEKLWAKEIEEEWQITKSIYDNRLKSIQKGVEIEKRWNAIRIEDEEKRLEEEFRLNMKALEQKKAVYTEMSKDTQLEVSEIGKAYTLIAETELEIEELKYKRMKELRDRDLADRQASIERWLSIAQTSASGLSSILGSIADLYENSGEADAKAQTKAKNLRIAGATIDMLGGVVSAWASAMSPTNSALTIWGQLAMGALSSATIISAGVANIAKIKNTDTSGNSAPATPIGASVSAPAIIQQIPITRTLTGASEEERLNQIATNTGKDQRVVLVYSDVEAAGRRVQVQQDESSF